MTTKWKGPERGENMSAASLLISNEIENNFKTSDLGGENSKVLIWGLFQNFFLELAFRKKKALNKKIPEISSSRQKFVGSMF